MSINKIKLPDNTSQDIHDARIPGVDSTPTSGSSNVITSGGVYAAIPDVEALTTSEIDTIWNNA